jgi:hypothetical protein
VSRHTTFGMSNGSFTIEGSGEMAERLNAPDSKLRVFDMYLCWK